MKSKTIVVCLLLVVAVLGLIVVFWRPSGELADEQSSPQEEIGKSQNLPPLSSNNARSNETTHTSAPASSKRGAKNVPIQFWGKVVDAAGAPIPNVKITFQIRSWKYGFLGRRLGEFPRFTTESDRNGLFSLSEVEGDVLTLERIEKEGYSLSPKTIRNYGYNISQNHIPSRANPVVIQMWKRGSRENLLQTERFFGVVPDGRAYIIDLISGSKIESDTASGDLRISVTRVPSLNAPEKISWSFAIQPIKGGIIETNDSFMYLAPEAGYDEGYIYDGGLIDVNGRVEVKKEFYFYAREGNIFGALSINVIPNYNGAAAFGMDWVINTNGSRNLER